MYDLQNKIGKRYVQACTYVSAGFALLILITLVSSSWEALTTQGWNLFSLRWNPATNEFGLLSMLFGSVVVTFIAMCLAVPLGIMTAIFTSEYLGEKYRFIVKSGLELLAGIPSIIYGLIGISFFSIWIQDAFSLQTGRTFMTAGILLACMILPTIITLTDDALRAVPNSYREAARGLGLYPAEIIMSSVIPIAKSNILGAVLLAFGRALGETMAVMLVIGSIDRIPEPFYDWLSPGQTITSKLGREIAETSFGSVHFSAMIFMGLLLFLIVVTVTIIAQRKNKLTDRLYE